MLNTTEQRNTHMAGTMLAHAAKYTLTPDELGQLHTLLQRMSTAADEYSGVDYVDSVRRAACYAKQLSSDAGLAIEVQLEDYGVPHQKTFSK